MDDVFLGIDKRADIPDHFKPARLEAYPHLKYGVEQACIRAPENALILSLIQERDDLGAADATPITFVAFLSAATEYPASFFATGNPRPIAERWSMPVIPADDRKISMAHLRRMPLLGEISRAFAIHPLPRRAPGPPSGLNAHQLPPDCWFPIPYEDLRDWLEARLLPDNRIERGERAARIPDERGERVYLALEDSPRPHGPRWVKIGKAGKTSPRERLRNQQCCNPRTLSHIRVWRVGPDPRAAETAFIRFLRALCSNSRSEWYMVDIARTLPEIDRFAAIQGYEPEVMWAGEA